MPINAQDSQTREPKLISAELSPLFSVEAKGTSPSPAGLVPHASEVPRHWDQCSPLRLGPHDCIVTLTRVPIPPQYSQSDAPLSSRMHLCAPPCARSRPAHTQGPRRCTGNADPNARGGVHSPLSLLKPSSILSADPQVSVDAADPDLKGRQGVGEWDWEGPQERRKQPLTTLAGKVGGLRPWGEGRGSKTGRASHCEGNFIFNRC